MFQPPEFQLPVFFLTGRCRQVTATANEGRELQFAIKLIFGEAGRLKS